MQKITIYIGADNTTGIVEKSTLTSVLNKYFMGYTVSDALGLWEGKEEASVRVEVSTDDIPDMLVLCNELKQALRQNAILYTVEDVKTIIV